MRIHLALVVGIVSLLAVEGCSPTGGGSSAATCLPGRLGDGGACQACGLNTCSAPTCDDGKLDGRSDAAILDCQYRKGGSNWATAMSYCAGLGSGWRLPSKGEALKIASSPNVCRTPLPGEWVTWTSTCSGAGQAWYVYYNGGTNQGNVDYDYINLSIDYALCVR